MTIVTSHYANSLFITFLSGCLLKHQQDSRLRKFREGRVNPSFPSGEKAMRVFYSAGQFTEII